MDLSLKRYAAGGGNAADGVHFGVNDFANLPDADAGTDLAGCFRSDPRNRKIRQDTEKRRVPMMISAAVILTVFLGCVLAISLRLYAREQVQFQIAEMIDTMEKTRVANYNLQVKVKEVQDLSRIGYIAVKNLGMVASGGENNIVMIMPEVERFAGSLAKPGGVEEMSGVSTASSVMEDEALDNARAGK